MGLREKIKNADVDSDINSLLKIGDTYEFASLKTKKAWASTAQRRLDQLINGGVTEKNNTSNASKQDVITHPPRVKKTKRFRNIKNQKPTR